MNIICGECGIEYNNQTARKCPLCTMGNPFKRKGKSKKRKLSRQMSNEIKNFKREEIYMQRKCLSGAKHRVKSNHR